MIRIIRNFEHQPNIEYIEALIGTNLTLYCKVILEGNDQLYSLKWFRQYNGSYYEFYSYISNPNQTIHHTPLPGIHFDLDEKPNGEIIHLINVNLGTEGIYRCEATSDEMFQIDRKEFKLTILVPLMETPKIIFPKKTFALGEVVQLKCISDLTRPASKIKWYINNINVPESNNKVKNWTFLDVYDYKIINHIEKKANKTKLDRSLSLLPTSISASLDDHIKQSPLRHEELGKKISLLKFMLTFEHLNKGSNHFSVRCVSMIETTKFYPQPQEHSEIDLQARSNHHLSAPIIEGLQDDYQIGDIVDVRCIIPNVNERLQYQIQWTINHKKIDRSTVMNIGPGQSKLCFKLTPRHLHKFGSFSLKCTIIQKWPIENIIKKDIFHEVSQMNGTTLEFDEYTNTSNFSINNWFDGAKSEKTLKSLATILIPIGVIMAVIIIG